MKNTISRIFFIYSNAWAAAAMVIGALLELFCAVGLFCFGSTVLAWFCVGGFVMLSGFALGMAADIYFDMKK
jgi:hypothetical protein